MEPISSTVSRYTWGLSKVMAASAASTLIIPRGAALRSPASMAASGANHMRRKAKRP